MRRLFSMLLFISLFQFVSFGQSEAKRIVDNLRTEYLGYSNYTISFNLVYDMPESDDIKYQGRLSEEGDKYALKLGDRQIICDGKDIWLYLPENNEIQINNYDKDEESLLSPKSFLKKDIDSEFEYRISEDNDKYIVLEFVPIVKNDDYFKVKIEIDKSSKQIKRFIAFHEDAVRTVLTIESLEHDKKIPSDTFVFNKDNFPGANIEDLRL